MGVIRHVYISFCSWSPFTLVDHTRVKLKWYYTLSTEKRLKINLVRKCLVPKSTYFFALNPLVIVDLSNSAWIKSYRPFYLRVLWTSYGVHHHKEICRICWGGEKRRDRNSAGVQAHLESVSCSSMGVPPLCCCLSGNGIVAQALSRPFLCYSLYVVVHTPH